MNPYRNKNQPDGKLEEPRLLSPEWRTRLILYPVLAVCVVLGYAALGHFLRRAPETEPPMPVVCRARFAGRGDGICWNGKQFIQLMPGFHAVQLDGVTYLVGWLKN